MLPPRLVHSHTDWALHVALSDSGSSVLSTGLDNTARLCTPYGRLELPLPAPALQCALSEAGTFALALRDGTVRTYDENGQETKLNSFPGFRSTCGAAISADAQVQFECFTSGVEHAVVLRNINTGAQISKEGNGRGRGVQLSDDGDRLAYIGDRSRATVSNENLDTLFVTHVDGDAGLAVDGYGVQVVIADAETLRVVDLRDGSARELQGYDAPGRYGRCATSWDGGKIVAAENDGFGVWDVSGTKINSFRTDHAGFQNGCAMSASGAQVVTAATDGKVRLWSTVRNVGRFVRMRETTEECRWWLGDGREAMNVA